MQENKFQISKSKANVLMLAIATLVMSFPVKAQEAMVDLPIGTIRSEVVFDAIQNQTNYLIAVNNSRTDNLSAKVTTSPQSVAEILNLLLGKNMTYKVNGNYILIFDKPTAPEPVAVVKEDKTRDLTITVVEETTGRPLDRVWVEVSGLVNAQGTTNANGRLTFVKMIPDAYVIKLSDNNGMEYYREAVVPIDRDGNVIYKINNDLKQPEAVAQPQPAPAIYEEPRAVEDTSNQLEIVTFDNSPVLVETNSHAPKAAIKTNLLYDFGALTPNLALEFGLGKRSTLNLMVGYNPWNLDGSYGDNKKLVHWLANIEYRWWLCERFNGHFFGIHVLGSQYNVSGHNIPLLFKKEYRYEGWAAGAGISYGYHWMWNKRMGMEFNIGLGYAYLEYDRYNCEKCSEKDGRYSKNYFGPTRAGISLVFMIK